MSLISACKKVGDKMKGAGYVRQKTDEGVYLRSRGSIGSLPSSVSVEGPHL